MVNRGRAPVRTVELLVGGGSLAFAAWALARPGSFATTAGIPRGTARLLGLRDLVLGALLVRRGGSAALTARGASDLVDAALAARRRPAVAALAASAGVVSLVAARAARAG